MRFFHRSAIVSVQIFRCPTTGDQKYPTTPTYIVEGAFQPQVRRTHSQEGGMFVIEYELFFDANVDVQRSDKLVINGTTYHVRNLLPMTMGVYPFTMAYVSKEA